MKFSILIWFFFIARSATAQMHDYAPDQDGWCIPYSYYVAADGCNHCSCDENGHTGSCTMLECKADSFTKRISETLLRSKAVKYYKSISCVPGSVFMDKCNYCHCSPSGTLAACTKMNCIEKGNPTYPQPIYAKGPNIISRKETNGDDVTEVLLGSSEKLVARLGDGDGDGDGIGIMTDDEHYDHRELGNITDEEDGLSMLTLANAMQRSGGKAGLFRLRSIVPCAAGQRYKKGCRTCICLLDGTTSLCTMNCSPQPPIIHIPVKTETVGYPNPNPTKQPSPFYSNYSYPTGNQSPYSTKSPQSSYPIKVPQISYPKNRPLFGYPGKTQLDGYPIKDPSQLGYPGDSQPDGYPIKGPSQLGYPGNSQLDGYPIKGPSQLGYPGNSQLDGYPIKGPSQLGYPGNSQLDGYPIKGPSQLGYPGNSQPDGYPIKGPSQLGYPGNSQPDGYPIKGPSQLGYLGTNQLDGYPIKGPSQLGYPGNSQPDGYLIKGPSQLGYPGNSQLDGYPIKGPSQLGYPGSSQPQLGYPGKGQPNGYPINSPSQLGFPGIGKPSGYGFQGQPMNNPLSMGYPSKRPGYQSFTDDYGYNGKATSDFIKFPGRGREMDYSLEQRESPEDFGDASQEVLFPSRISGSSFYQYDGVPGGVENPFRSGHIGLYNRAALKKSMYGSQVLGRHSIKLD